jgi:hypothetical protein
VKVKLSHHIEPRQSPNAANFRPRLPGIGPNLGV